MRGLGDVAGTAQQGDTVRTTTAAADANIQFWLRVRQRSSKRWRQIVAEASKNTLVGAVVIGCALMMLHGSPTAVAAAPLSSATLIGIGSGLAAFISAIWVAVAVQGGAVNTAGSADLETMLVRLRVLGVGARVLSVGMTVLTGCALAWYSGLPAHVDLVRFVAAVSAWALLMTVGADAIGFASDPEGGGLAQFHKIDPLLRTQRLLVKLGADPEVDTVRSVGRTLLRGHHLLRFGLTVIALPVAATLADSVLNPPHGTQLLGRLILAVVFSIAAFGGWTLLSYLIADRQFVEAALIAAGTALVVITVTLDIAQAVLQQTPQPTMPHLARITLSVLLIMVPPLFIHGFGAIPSRAPRASRPQQTAVVVLVIALLLRRHRRQHNLVHPPPRRPWEPLAIVAAVLLPLPPVALLLSKAATARLRSQPTHRGRPLAVTVRWIAVGLLAAPAVGLLLLAYPPG